MYDHELLVVDIETGGLDKEKHSLLEVGAVVWRNGNIVDEFQTYIRHDPYCVDAQSLQFTGIDLTKHDSKAVSSLEAGSAFMTFVTKNFGVKGKQKVMIVCHNPVFDMPFIKKWFKDNDCESDLGWFSYRYIDTHTILKFLEMTGWITDEMVGLKKALEYFKVPHTDDKLHGALYDAKVTALLLTELTKFFNKGRIVQLSQSGVFSL